MYISEMLKRIDMATIKSYTDLEQSKKLAKILPLESADMKILSFGIDIKRRVVPIDDIAVLNREDEIPCWSLAALLGVLPRIEGLKPVLDLEINYVQYPSDIDLCATADNPVDACYEMILKLHELDLV
jgi:hypothetical protein